MAFATFVPPYGASTKFEAGAVEDHEPRVLTAGFGDGYEQRTPDGINTDLATVSPSWPALTWGQGQTIVDFFAARKGVTPFYFTMPGESTPRKWIAKKWSRRFDTDQLVTISAQWKEVVDAA